MDNKRIGLIVPSLKPGGMERIMSEVANYFARDKNLEVHLITFSRSIPFFNIDDNVHLHQPANTGKNRLSLIFNNALYLRKKLKKIKPYSILSFGSMYNSFVIIASLGLGIKVYVSDRSNPYRNTILTFKNDPIKNHDGIFHYFLKKIFYQLTDGIFVQTELAKKIESRFSGHKNIILFPNPIRDINEYPEINKRKWIINVGRFVKTKNQKILIDIFSQIDNDGWELIFAGDGPKLENAKKLARSLNLDNSVRFLGTVSDIDKYLRSSQIFAFTSLSEGFPNALAEGMKSSLACISFDCIAGPSDLISHEENGYLIEEGNIEEYKFYLKKLMDDENLRRIFQEKASRSMDKFQSHKILNKVKMEMVN